MDRATLRRATVAVLLVAYVVLAMAGSLDKSPAYDETAHLTAGVAYWRFDDYRLQPENGNLPQRWIALPVVLSGRYRFPTTNQPAWLSSDVWALGDQFGHELGNDLGGMLLRGRGMVALLGAALGLVVYLWSRELFGEAGGLISLTLCTLCPTMRAHGQLMTSDMAAALLLTLSVCSIWGLLHRVTAGRVVGGTLAIAALFLTKATAVLVIPMALAMVIVWLSAGGPIVLDLGGRGVKPRTVGTLAGRASVVAGLMAGCVAVTVGMVWVACGLRYSAFSDGSTAARFYRYRSLVTAAGLAGAPGGILRRLGEHRLLPESFLYGIAYVLAHTSRAAFLDGEYSLNGWRRYFPYCLLVKTPLPLFGILAAAAASWWPRRGDRRGPSLVYRATPLWVLLGVYWAVAIQSRLNIGHRHILPTYPAMFILAGGSAVWLGRRHPIAKVLVFGLLAWFAIESARSYPHDLAYFNEIVGRRQGYRHLVDSNLDWGQDLPGLKRWLDEHNRPGAGRRAVHLAYFGKGRPESYGIHAVRLPLLSVKDPVPPPLKGGIYCIGATSLQGLYARYPGRWNRDYEARYRTALAEIQQPAADEMEARLLSENYQCLRTARLMAFLRHREPLDEIGYSILIYDLTNEDVRIALTGPPAELDELSWTQREGVTRGDRKSDR